MNTNHLDRIKKKTADLNTIEQMDLTDRYRIFHPSALACIFFLTVHRTFSRIDRMLAHKTSLN